MTEREAQAFLARAWESLGAAEALAERGSFGFAASRGYYAMFYATQALLLRRGLAFSRHSAVIAAFGREFVRSGILGPEYHRYLLDAFEARQVGDYEPLEQLSEATARLTIDRARLFIQAAEKLLESDSTA